MDADTAAAIPSDYVYWALALRSEQEEAQGIDWRSMSAEETVGLTHKLTENWDNSMRQMILHQDPKHTLPLLSGVMPLPLARWRNEAELHDSPFVTLIGDAAHAMPPTAGVGATSALTDAAILGEVLDKHGLTVHALEEYEKQMFDYGAKAIEGGCKNGKMFMPGLRDMSEMQPMDKTW
jgi:2-polyprenyl-6-methoxyphenol hydroxylase-like FAD-dependent oxidoreductase